MRWRLDRIAELIPHLNALPAVFGEEALARAAEVDRRVADGQRDGPLASVPISLSSMSTSPVGDLRRRLDIV